MGHHREWPLVLFTLVTQLAVGLFSLWGLSALTLPAGAAGGRVVVVVTLAALAAGGAAAAFHLGRPAGAVFSFSHWRRSWLSREALFSFGFGAAVTSVLVLELLGRPTSILGRAAVLAGILSGLGLVAAISRLYQLRTVPAWDHAGTPATFFTSSLLTGASTLMLILMLGGPAGAEFSKFSALGKPFILLLVLLQAGIFIGSTIFVSNQGRAGYESMRLLGSKLRLPLILRWAFSGAGAALLLAGTSPLILGTAYGLLLASEVVGRYLFYGMHLRTGL